MRVYLVLSEMYFNTIKSESTTLTVSLRAGPTVSVFSYQCDHKVLKGNPLCVSGIR